MRDFFNVQKKAFAKTKQSLEKQPMGLFLPLILGLVLSIVDRLGYGVFHLGLLTGFLMALAYSVVIGSGMYLYKDLVRYGRLKLESASYGWRTYLAPVYGVYFLLMLVRLLGQSINMTPIFILVLYFLLNPLPEVVYIRDSYGIDAVKYCVSFLRENFIYWLPSLLVFVLLHALLLGPLESLYSIQASDLIDQMAGLRRGLSLTLGPRVIKDLVLYLITGVYMIFRGHLFTILSTSSRRKRQFMGEFQ